MCLSIILRLECALNFPQTPWLALAAACGFPNVNSESYRKQPAGKIPQNTKKQEVTKNDTKRQAHQTRTETQIQGVMRVYF